MADRPIFPGTLKTVGVTILPADTTTPKTLLTAGASGSRVSQISIVSDDTAAMNVGLWYNNGSTDFLIGTVNVPTLSGTDGATPSVSLLNIISLPFLGEDLSIYIEAAKVLKVGVLSAVTTAKTITVVAQYGDY